MDANISYPGIKLNTCVKNYTCEHDPIVKGVLIVKTDENFVLFRLPFFKNMLVKFQTKINP
jgi:hypothetical protein